MFTIGLVEDTDLAFTDSRSRSKAIDLLRMLANDTGGRVVFPKGKKMDLQSLLNQLAILAL